MSECTNKYFCHTCDEQEFEDTESMMKHLKEVHGLDGMKFNRRMTFHLDARDYFLSQYEWDAPGVKFSSSHRCERAEDDMMRHV